MTDYFLYSGSIAYESCLNFIELVEKAQTNKDGAALVLSTYGGDARAAYRMGKCLQSRYENVKIFIPGMCKSAGTILAIAANELIFSPSGELGPLDVQMAKKDDIADRVSGLDIIWALNTLEDRAKKIFHELTEEIVGKSQGIISFPVASHSTSEIISSLFGPIFAKVDLAEFGSRARAMEIATHYCGRLDWKYQNLIDVPYVTDFLTWKCPSHNFVIDIDEAKMLFKNVRVTDEDEEELVRSFHAPSEEIAMEVITDKFQEIESKKIKNSHENSKSSKDNQSTANERNEESRDRA